MDPKKMAKGLGGQAGKGIAKKGQAGIGRAVMGALGGTFGSQAALMVNAYASAALNNEYPNVGFRFDVEIDGIIAAHFSEASGAEWEMEGEAFHEGGLNFHERRLIGTAKFTPLTLKRGFTPAGSEFFLWMKSTFENREFKRRNLSIVILNQEGIEVGRLNFKNAFISKYTGPAFNADTNAVGFESVVLKYDYFEYEPRDLNEVMAESATSMIGSLLGSMIPGR
jgi:phage tail-like protein